MSIGSIIKRLRREKDITQEQLAEYLGITSPILRGYSSGGWIMEASGNRSQSILHWLTTDNKLEAYRSDPRYEAMVSRLEKVAVKPQ